MKHNSVMGRMTGSVRIARYADQISIWLRTVPFCRIEFVRTAHDAMALRSKSEVAMPRTKHFVKTVDLVLSL